MKDVNFSISYTIIKNKPKSLFFNNIKNNILGTNYELSLVFIGKVKSKTLNRKYRKKDKFADVLTFLFSKTEGEIFICPEIAKQKAKKFEMKEDKFITYLFIHGLLHLKGFRHGRKMEEEEERLKKKYIKFVDF